MRRRPSFSVVPAILSVVLANAGIQALRSCSKPRQRSQHPGFPHSRERRKGFTLIEVLIAMIIIAIAFTAILKATNNSLVITSRLQSRIAAHWVAEEILTSAQVGSLQLPVDNRELTGETMMLGQMYQWQITSQATSSQGITELTVSVSQHQQSLDTLVGSHLNPSLLAGGMIN